ncbi:MAG: hypothetical protein IPM98_18400 [Lewinellaceae bacterium]|nr:hypothetical protein [Lewinellaceae bacterium]
MHQIIRSIAAFLLWAYLVGAVSAQSALIGIRADKKQTSAFFHADGREAFRLPAEFQLVQWLPDDHGPDGREMYFLTFDQTPIVLKSAALGFVLVDAQGRIADTLGYDYAAVGQFIGPFAPARLNGGGRGVPRTVLLDKNGRQAFGDRLFYRAQPFADGQVAVQAEGPDGPWLILDEQGKTVCTFPAETGKHIEQVRPLRNGLRKTMLRYPRGYNHDEFLYRYQYFNRDGVLQFELNTLFPDREILAVADTFVEGICRMLVAATDGEQCAQVVYLDTAGKVLHTNPCVLRATEFRNGKAFYSIADSSGYVHTYIVSRDGSIRRFAPDPFFDYDLTVDIAGGRYELVELRDKTTDQFVANLWDRHAGLFVRRFENPVAFAKAAEFGPFLLTAEYLPGSHYAENVLRYRETLQEAFRSPKHILTVVDSLVLLADPSLNYQLTPNELAHLDGRLLWSTVKKDYFALGLGEALRHAPDVRSLSLQDDTGMADMAKMPNLETLHIGHVRADNLPHNVFSASPKLKKLALYDCRNLKKLPPLPTVQELTIQGAQHITNLEAAVASSKNLKKLTWVDSATLDEAVLQRLKTSRPGLQIRFSALAYEMQVEEAPTPPVKSKN